MKRCSKCRRRKSVTEFHKQRRAHDGLQAYCKSCCKTFQKKYQKENREHRIAVQRLHYVRNRAAYAAYHAAYQQAHPEVGAAGQARRRARLAQVETEDFTRQEIFLRDAAICGICGEFVDESNWHMDHIIPISKGGPHTRANVQVAHPRCNREKGGRIL